MRYMLLVYAPDGAGRAAKGTYGALAGDLAGRGALVGSHELEAADSATSVRVRAGDTLVSDGPFAPTPEQLEGLFVVEAESLDEAIDVAARIPAAREGLVEIRPVIVREAAA